MLQAIQGCSRPMLGNLYGSVRIYPQFNEAYGSLLVPTELDRHQDGAPSSAGLRRLF